MTAFPQGDVVIFAIIYGTASDWVRNVLAAGGCEAVYRSRRLQLIAPRLVGRPEGEAAIPGPVRLVLRLLRVQNFLVLQARRD